MREDFDFFFLSYLTFFAFYTFQYIPSFTSGGFFDKEQGTVADLWEQVILGAVSIPGKDINIVVRAVPQDSF